MTLTAGRLREALHYDPKTGVFTWLVAPNGRIAVGQIAGTLDPGTGYIRVSIDGKTYQAHRLAWLYQCGSWPTHEIDHRDLVKTNNRWCNPREATASQNQRNRGAYRNNTSGFKGVSLKASTGKWEAGIAINGRRRHLGYFNTAEAAAAAYEKAANDLHGKFARTE